MKLKTYSITHARKELTRIVRAAAVGEVSVITRRGLPVAAVVSVEQWQAQKRRTSSNAGILALRGTGCGFWIADGAKATATLRDEWGN